MYNWLHFLYQWTAGCTIQSSFETSKTLFLLKFLLIIQSCNVEVTFSPRLENSDIVQEASRIAEKMAEIKRKISEENAAKEKPEETAVHPGKKQLAKIGKKSGKGSPKRGQTPASTPGIRNQTTPSKSNVNKDFNEE